MNSMFVTLRTIFTSKTKRSETWIFGVMLVFAVLSLLSALALGIEEFQQLKDPHATLLCNINAILNCSAVMQTWQAHLLGFPNTFLGLMAEPVVITLAVAGLAGVKFPRPFMFSAQIFYAVGSLFAYWLFFQSLYAIGELCPLCLIITVSTTFVFETMLRYNIRENNLYLSERAHKTALRWINKDYDKFIVAIWLALLVALALLRFPDLLG